MGSLRPRSVIVRMSEERGRELGPSSPYGRQYRTIVYGALYTIFGGWRSDPPTGRPEWELGPLASVPSLTVPDAGRHYNQNLVVFELFQVPS